jgi:phosphoadenosine phosphosulfate reductase
MNWTLQRSRDEATRLAVLPAADLVAWALAEFGPRTVVATSFSKEDVALLALAGSTGLPFRAVALDTGRLPEETHWAAEEVRSTLGVAIEWVLPSPTDVESLLGADGTYGFRGSLEARRRCCHVRKVLPLRRALADAPAWLTGLRRAQSVTRVDVPVLEWDAAFGLVKLNPLAAWTDAEVDAFTLERRLPVHRLYGQGYPSIGCAPCTRAIAPGEHPRAGRWWWEDPDHKECGLHPLERRR